jgi:hypothetical protein
MIKYKQSYLGKGNNVFGFIRSSTASFVANKLNYEYFKVVKVEPSIYVLCPSPRKSILKPLNKKELQVKSFDISIGTYFSSINNMELILVDQASENAGNIIMSSSFCLDSFIPLSEEHLRDQLSRIINKDQYGDIDYVEDLKTVLLARNKHDKDEWGPKNN